MKEWLDHLKKFPKLRLGYSNRDITTTVGSYLKCLWQSLRRGVEEAPGQTEAGGSGLSAAVRQTLAAGAVRAVSAEPPSAAARVLDARLQI